MKNKLILTMLLISLLLIVSCSAPQYIDTTPNNNKEEKNEYPLGSANNPITISELESMEGFVVNNNPNDLRFCESTDDKETCNVKSAIKTGDISYCDKFSDIDDRNRCYILVVAEQKIKSICNKINDNEAYDYCISAYYEFEEPKDYKGHCNEFKTEKFITACEDITTSCTDTDGGINPEEFGEVFIKGEIDKHSKDFCNGNSVVEMSCDENKELKVQTIDCSLGDFICEDGACIKPEIIDYQFNKITCLSEENLNYCNSGEYYHKASYILINMNNFNAKYEFSIAQFFAEPRINFASSRVKNFTSTIISGESKFFELEFCSEIQHRNCNPHMISARKI